MAKLLLNCKEASRLISQRLDTKLGMGERLALRLHLAICQGCSRVNRQLQFLRRAMAKVRETLAETERADRN